MWGEVCEIRMMLGVGEHCALVWPQRNPKQIGSCFITCLLIRIRLYDSNEEDAS